MVCSRFVLHDERGKASLDKRRRLPIIRQDEDGKAACHLDVTGLAASGIPLVADPSPRAFTGDSSLLTSAQSRILAESSDEVLLSPAAEMEEKYVRRGAIRERGTGQCSAAKTLTQGKVVEGGRAQQQAEVEVIDLDDGAEL